MCIKKFQYRLSGACFRAIVPAMFRNALHTLAVLGVLFITWCLFSGIFTPLFLSIAFVCCLLVTFITRRMEVLDREGHPFPLIYLAPIYWLWLTKEIITSGLRVTRLVWSLEPKISPRFAWVPNDLKSDLARTIYANSLTLTPGTVCVDIEKNRTYVHALEGEHIADDPALADMEKRVARISRFAETDY